MDSLNTFLSALENMDPLYLVAGACLLVALAIFRLAGAVSGRLGQLRGEVRQAAENITVADAARKREATLAAVRRFESDPEVREAVRHIWHKTRTPEGTDYSRLDAEDRFHVLSYLNYLDGIAVGLKQGIFDDTVARDYLQHVVHKSVHGLLLEEPGETWKAGPPLVDPEKFTNLIQLQKQWSAEEVHPLFRMIGHGVTRGR